MAGRPPGDLQDFNRLSCDLHVKQNLIDGDDDDEDDDFETILCGPTELTVRSSNTRPVFNIA